ncbi:MAG: Stp1/IreP family PP2C-type Ser/Thr phosphatase [Clostridia bacterium]|nr:Stp1/IreP family PP2C-type Ser/Thr phosphatase [Clostridia bacterium]
MIVTGLTHVGNVRSTNEDTVLIAAGEMPRYALVADGMGGHAAGEVASSVAAAAIREYIERLGCESLDEDQIVDAFQYANDQILQHMAAHPEHSGMGTTLTFAYMEDRSLTVGHVGDSSAYLAKNGGLKKITRDHTYVQKLIDTGAIRAEAAADFPFRNVITRALGTSPLQVDIYKEQWMPGDLLLLCSDGLTAYADRDHLLAELASGDSAPEIAQRLLDFALEQGGRDNISVIVAENPDGKA